MEIFGVHISDKDKKEIAKDVRKLLNTRGNLIVTPNPEMLVAAKQSGLFRRVLNSAPISVPDGIGLTFASKGKLSRYPGTDLLSDLLDLLQKEQKTVYFVGRNDQNWKSEVEKALHKHYPKLRIVGVGAGPQLALAEGEQGRSLVYDDIDKNNELLADIIQTAPDVLVVGIGHEKQELWLHEHLPGLPSVAIGIGVGGAIDYLAGIVPRAPKWMRRIGLEWLYRALHNPKRLPRILTATIVFPLLYLYDHAINHK